jgi:tetratricopeptide (TPR) repeat protein
MAKLFISYRRSDTQMVAGRLRESLARRLGERAIFRDKDSIAPGADWTQAIETALSAGGVVVALIGPSWVTAQDATGRRRLDDPADWNRIELERAFARRCRVIPLLVDDAKMPTEAELPEGLKGLARSNALKLRDDDWDSDIERLVRALGIDAAPSWTRRAAAAAIAIAVILAGGIGYWWLGAVNPVKRIDGGGSTFRSDILNDLRNKQYEALNLMSSDKPKAIRLIDDNLAAIAQALRSFPDDANLHALAGYAAKNVYASSKGVLPPETRKTYLARARTSFEHALKLDPKNAGAVNGMGNVLFYEGRFDDAIRYHEQALNLKGGKYDEAAHDLDLVKRVKSGAVPFDP